MLSYWRQKPEPPKSVPFQENALMRGILVVSLMTLGLSMGIVIGHTLFYRTCKNIKIAHELNQSFVIDKAFSLVNVERLKRDLLKMSELPHITGWRRDNNLAKYVFKEWSQYMDTVRIIPYTVLVSYPNRQKPNVLSIRSHSKVIFETSSNDEDDSTQDLDNQDIPLAYVAYSPPGNVSGPIIYVNYGMEKDFLLLQTNYSTGVNNSICLLRIGRITAGQKIHTAERFGCAAVLLYPDPELVAPTGQLPFPDSEWLPDYGIRRGSAHFGFGDPLTPMQPSIDGARRIRLADANIPKIPSQCISYGDARVIFSYMRGPKAPNTWRGLLKTSAYSIGPGFENKELRATLVIHNMFKNVTIKNVIGKLSGNKEPDRMVIHGSHRDAFVYGASQPGTGHSQMMEVARVFGIMVKNGWRPKRSIVFASWAARKFGAIGSQEFVEEHLSILSDRCLAYLNTDSCAAGSIPEFVSSPSLYEMVISASKLVPDPRDTTRSLYRSWREGHMAKMRRSNPDEVTDSIGSDSDIGPFEFFAGISVTDVTFRYSNFSFYFTDVSPVADTALDNLAYVTTIIDPDYKIQKACTQMNIVMLVKMADSILVPLNPRYVAKLMKMSIENINKVHNDVLMETGVNLSYLSDAIGNFTIAAKMWMDNVNNATKLMESDSEPCWRCMNEQARLADRAFVATRGLPGRPSSRHIISSPSERPSGRYLGFPGIHDTLYSYSKATTLERRNELIDILVEHVAECMILVKTATKLLTSYDI